MQKAIPYLFGIVLAVEVYFVQGRRISELEEKIAEKNESEAVVLTKRSSGATASRNEMPLSEDRQITQKKPGRQLEKTENYSKAFDEVFDNEAGQSIRFS